MGIKDYGKTKGGERGLWGMNKYAIFVAATPNYIGYINALLNSIEKRKLYRNCDLTVYLLHHDGYNEEYLQRIARDLSYVVIPIEIKRSDFDLPPETKRIEFIKRTRYKIMAELGTDYDVVCLLDGDMFFVSDQFMRLFDLVKKTSCCIGCNERFKWGTGGYKLSGKPMFEKSGKMFQFICNTPAVFDMKADWHDVLDCYCDIAKNGTQEKNNTTVGIGDIFCWNLAIQKMEMNEKIIAFPMETMAQVHHTNMRGWTYPIDEGGYWHTFSGDRIYIIHGRVARSNFVDGCLKKYRQLEAGRDDMAKVEPNIKKGLQAIQKEWYDLNYNGKIKLCDYVEEDQIWKTFKGD